MADDLSDLDELSPAGTDLLVSGDNAIRDTRRKIINWAEDEHHLTGEHKFTYGAPAARPAAGKAGRIWFDTTNRRGELDTGIAWEMLRVVGSSQAYETGAVTIPVWPSESSLLSLAVDVVPSSKVLLIARAMAYNVGSTILINFHLKFDGSEVTGSRNIISIVGSTYITMLTMAITAVQPSSGSLTAALYGYTQGSATTTASYRNIIALVL